MKLTEKFNSKSTPHFFVFLDNLKLSTQLKQTLPKSLVKEIESLAKLKVKLKQITKITSSNVLKEKFTLHIVPVSYKKLNKQKLKLIGYNIAKTIQTEKLNKINLVTDQNLNISDLDCIYLGLQIGSYKFENFKKTTQKLETINFINNLNQSELKKSILVTKALAESQNFVKDLVNTPSLNLTPLELANQAKKIANESSKIKLKILKEKDLLKNNLNLIYSVGLGSGQESRLIILEYKNGPKKEQPTLLVGKGVTFDAGGLNLKPTSGIENMKMDMAGAATVLGFFKILTKLNLPINIVGVIPAVENLLGHNAYKPGDILTAHNQKTIEITNTDAEGRLILADAISYGIQKYNPNQIIDIATLTGACIVALGHAYTALISNNKKLVKKMWKASLESGEKAWPLPLDNYHRQKVKGDISDYKNWTSGVQAGSVMGGAFLEKFVQKKPWIHLDIAGSAFYETKIDFFDKGATGQPLGMLYQFFK